MHFDDDGGATSGSRLVVREFVAGGYIAESRCWTTCELFC